MAKTLKWAIDIFDIWNGVSLGIVPWSLSELDIIIKYKEEFGTGHWRQPKHIHYLVDLMLKRENDFERLSEVLTLFERLWEMFDVEYSRNTISQLRNNNYTIADFNAMLRQHYDLSRLNVLDRYGCYQIEFMILLGALLMLQEKVNNKDTYYFITIIEKLKSQDPRVIYDCINLATARYG